MDVFFGEWLNLLLRWAHMVVGIGWIGTSFYFMALDYTLLKREKMNPGVLGTSWQVHGGGFYHVEKYTVAPPALPDVLHWFKWEAYLTWVTGFGLLIVQYYVHADAFLIDPAVMPIEPWQAIAISIGSLAAGWFVYDGICRSKIGENPVLLALTVFALILLAAVLYTKVFSGRGAFIHVGALIGTIMAVNVFGVIIPNQKKMIAQMIAGREPEARFGEIGKQRSVHNNYLTLPVLLMMVSQHYPFLFTHPQSWLVVALILVSGGLIRHVLNRVEAADDFNSYGWAVPVAAIVLMSAIYVTAPQSSGASAGPPVSDAQALEISQKHCVSCHAKAPIHPAFKEPPKNMPLETVRELKRYSTQIYMQTVQNRAMPLGNQTGMTDEERAALGRWVRGAR
ncbi:MAG: cysteine desulfurase [Alphaproteobacteria bacterium]|nr:cysteine desulfurase [Alphaproteobacteria bacterium]